MRLRAYDIAHAANGTLVGEDVEVSGFSTDTRTLVPGELFVATRGTRNGHEFIPEALGQGANAYMSDGPTLKQKTGIIVGDTVKALADVASLVRRRMGMNTDVFAITGSVGKTSTKDLLATILGRIETCSASAKSFNNEIGVPLSILNAKADSDSLVLEMGARHVGNIEYLCDFARPTIGVVTNVGLAHLGEFGSVDAIAQTKGELIAALPHDGTAVLNVMDDRVLAMKKRTRARVLTYGLGVGDVQARSVVLDDELRPSFRLHTPRGAVSVFLSLRGEHQVVNALAAAAAAYADDVSLSDIAEGLEAARPLAGRMETKRSRSGAIIINDSYNANPVSMKAALQAMRDLPVSGRKYAILGYMAELGDASPTQHEAMAANAKSYGIEIVSVNAPEYRVANYDSAEEAVRALGPVSTGDAVLVKGSRVAGLERAANQLLV